MGGIWWGKCLQEGFFGKLSQSFPCCLPLFCPEHLRAPASPVRFAHSDPDWRGQGLLGAGCQEIGAKCNFIHQHQFAADACETSSEIWEQMRFRLAVNEAVLPSPSPAELTPLLWQSCSAACSSWCYWPLIRSVYTPSFALDFCFSLLAFVFRVGSLWTILFRGCLDIFAGSWQRSVNITAVTSHNAENMPSHQLGCLLNLVLRAPPRWQTRLGFLKRGEKTLRVGVPGRTGTAAAFPASVGWESGSNSALVAL